MEQFVIFFLMMILMVLAFAIIYWKDLLAAIILLGLYSLVTAAAFVVMDAVDVAFTEAAVGAGISTILLLGTLNFTKRRQKTPKQNPLPALLLVGMTGGLLIYGTLDLPRYGDDQSPANINPELTQHYLLRSKKEIGVPNVVTSVLASYRGYDTLGETVVVFTAAIAVLSLLGVRRRRSQNALKKNTPNDKKNTVDTSKVLSKNQEETV